ncbi:hypothetical protein [Microbacterium allomyrinae]|uniref:Uncharacterized protein n=1 Tax=Microbacterium allomyrinae TaxID=2830666 RepID=A0A9X1LVE6_9MICO|nr:hypothetical protein [Microbacterium allomyrinae]MCC2032448.1 hypothetical protein [Microbacterium allomyrinae]
MATGHYDEDGFWIYGEDDLADEGAGFSEVLNKSARAIPDAVHARVTTELASDPTVAAAAAAAVDGELDAKNVPEFEVNPEDVYTVRFENGEPFIRADETRGIYSKVTLQDGSVRRAALAPDVAAGLISGAEVIDLDGTGWAFAVMFRDPATGALTVESGVRIDGTVYPENEGGGGSPIDETGPAWMQSGDSMSLGLATRMATLTGEVWIDNAIGGERSYDIAGRTSANPIWLAVDGGEIPASGAVFVTPYYNGGATGFTATTTLMKQGTKSVNPSRLAGVEGTFVWVEGDGRYRFTRATAGAAVPVPYREPLITAARDTYAGYNQVIQLGRNNVADLDRVLEDTHSMVQWQTGGRRKFLVVGVMNATNEIAGSGTHTAVVALNAALKREYGFRFVDVRRKLIDDGLAMAGITPTGPDLTDIGNDTIPTSLRAAGDVLHLNDAAKDVQARIVYDRMTQIGWF